MTSVAPQPDCYENTFCVEFVETDGVIALHVTTLVEWEVTLALDMKLENMRSSEALPMVRTLSGNRKSNLVELNVADPYKPWSYEFDFKWMMGSPLAKHARSVTYALPFERGSAFLVGQGFNGSYTHHGKFAVDFAMPEGTAVRAARGGVVVDVEESFSEGGHLDRLKTRANYVSIRHDDGTIGTYVHLKHSGADVSTGMQVREGDLIGWSGSTGFASGPHLHFEVYTLDHDLERQTIPIEFRTRGRSAEILREGRTYSH